MDLTNKSDSDLKTIHEWAAAQYEKARRAFDQSAHAREDAWLAVETVANEIHRRAEASSQRVAVTETVGRF